MTNSIYQFLVKYHGNWDNIYDAINNKERIACEPEHEIKDNNIFIVNDNYPEKLKSILLPPFFVFYKGDIKLIDQNIITIIGKIKINDLNQIIKMNKTNILCFNNNDLTDSIYQTLITTKQKFIVVCEGGIDIFKHELTNDILLISEYNNSKDYQSSTEQTIERILFAFANKIYFSEINTSIYKNVEINLKQIKKPIYTNLCYETLFDQQKINKNNVIFINNIDEIS